MSSSQRIETKLEKTNMKLGKDGFAETPLKIVEDMCSKSIERFQSENNRDPKSCIDISGGDGRFLCEMLRRLKPTVKELPNFICYELDECRAKKAQDCIQKCLEDLGYQKEEISTIQMVHITDSLTKKWSADIIIGNPPYLRSHEMSSEEKTAYKKEFPTLRGSFDYMMVFMVKAMKGVEQYGSIASMIVSRTWQAAESAQDIRKDLRDNGKAFNLKIWDFKDSQVFEETVLCSIFLLSKSDPDIKIVETVYDRDTGNITYGRTIQDKPKYEKKPFGYFERTFGCWKQLKNLGVVFTGVKPRATDVYVESKAQENLQRFGKENPFDSRYSQQYLPKYDGKWKVKEQDLTRILYLSNIDFSKIDEVVKEYLIQNRKKLENRVGRGNKQWYELIQPGNETFFRKDWKIICRELTNSKRLELLWDEEQLFTGSAVFTFFSDVLTRDEGLYLIGFLNSQWCCTDIENNKPLQLLKGGKPRFNKGTFEDIDVPFDKKWFEDQTKNEDVYTIISIVGKILKQVDDTSILENELNSAVASLMKTIELSEQNTTVA